MSLRNACYYMCEKNIDSILESHCYFNIKFQPSRLIGLGARGGRGSGGMGSTLGAQVRGVIELAKGETLYFLIGQPGMDACPKNLGFRQNYCQQSNQTRVSSGGTDITSLVREMQKMEMKDGGGGGGGATYIFTVRTIENQHYNEVYGLCSWTLGQRGL